MKIIAIYLAQQDAPRFVQHYELLNGEPIILLTTERTKAVTFNAEAAFEAQRLIRDAIVRFIAHDGANMLRILRDTVAVMIEEDELEPEFIVCKLTGIRRIPRPLQTQGFIERADVLTRMATVEGNFEMMLVESPNQAIKAWWIGVERVLRQMPPTYHANLRLADQFLFDYQICEVKENG